MKGLELSRAYFEEFGLPMLKEQFPELLPYLAAGRIGSGSECLGFDDEISTDHDFEPGFLLFLPGEKLIDRRAAFRLERAYSKLPKEYRGYKRSLMAPVGGARWGVVRTEEYLQEKLGRTDTNLSAFDWLSLPSQSLLELTDGSLFLDNLGTATRIREELSFYPPDIRLKKLAGHLLLAAQAGQYNYARCLSHGEEAAAQLAVFEFVRHAASAIFLLNEAYEPYYKWTFRALRQLPKLSIEAELMEYLLTTDNGEKMREEKTNVIEGIAADLIDELIVRKLSKAVCGDLEKHAYSVNDEIGDSGIRNLHILAGV
ncbi:MAG: DUF4037 domain-containing protein [Lachnospiraceae bacterium]|nr:DUF4037 domain-containing protein [Lachnospiraceae bacterium]